MDNLYFNEFREILWKKQPSVDQLTLNDFLATFAALPPLLEKSDKCALSAKVFQAEGNELFATGNYEYAAIRYTGGLRKAPPYSECAALLYANRSAVLYQLKAYEECVLDIDRALDLPYPDNLRAKIITRKAAAVSQIKTMASEEEKSCPVDDLRFARGENAKLPGAGRGIDIVYTRNEGRKLVASMPFQTGDVLVVQEPFLPVLKVGEDLKYCHYCLKKSLCLIPCDKCTYEVYCSNMCRTEAYKSHHRIECRIQSTLVSAVPLNEQSGFLTQRLLCQLRCLVIFTEQGINLDALYDDFDEMERNSNPSKAGFTGERFVGNTRKAFVNSLFGKELACNPELLFEACYLVTLLRNFTNFFKINADIPVVAKLLAKLHNAYSLNHVSIQNFGNRDTKVLSSSPLIGLMVHKFCSNTIWYHDNKDRFVLHASQEIKPGDEISYTCRVPRYVLSESIIGSGECLKCNKTFQFSTQEGHPFQVDQTLQQRLRENPYDITGLWKLLNLTYEKNELHSLRTKTIKMLLENAYEGCCDLADNVNLRIVGIL